MQKIKLVVEQQDDQVKIERFLKTHGFPHMLVAQILRKGHVKVNSKRIKKSCILTAGDTIDVYRRMEEESQSVFSQQHIKLAEELTKNLLYKDDNLLILNKPAGLAVQGGSKIKISVDDLSELLKFELAHKPKLVHRIDRDTSGILVMARNNTTARSLGGMFKESNAIKKCYIGLCNGVPHKLQGTISIPLAKLKLDQEKMAYCKAGDMAITHYKVIKHNSSLSLILFQIVTGRTHQIRAHCAIAGLPIVGDAKYNLEYFQTVKQRLSLAERKEFILNNKPISPLDYKKLCLHSYSIEFVLYDKRISVEAPLPPDYLSIIQKCFGSIPSDLKQNIHLVSSS